MFTKNQETMNLLFFYLLGCSIAYTIAKKSLTLKNPDVNLDVESFFENEQKKITKLGSKTSLIQMYILLITFLSWIPVLIVGFIKIKTLYYNILIFIDNLKKRH